VCVWEREGERERKRPKQKVRCSPWNFLPLFSRRFYQVCSNC